MTDQLTLRAALELAEQEALVQEMYFDNAKPPRATWSIGITDASGHAVERYRDNPQSIERCLEVYVWLLRTKYIPEVLHAFRGHALTEAQFAAAVSFHYNTGAIARAEWVKAWLQGGTDSARHLLETNFLNGGALTARRSAEAKLFFDGHWSQTGKISIYPVKKPGYTPDWRGVHRQDISAEMAQALAAKP